MARIHRRHLLTRSAALGAAVAGGLVFTEDSARATTAIPTSSRVMAVVQHTGNRAQVAAPGVETATGETVEVRGFPPGWQLRTGDLVLVTSPNSTTPNVAFPLVTRLVGKVERRVGWARVGSASIELRPQTIQRNNAIADPSVTGPKFEAYVIENSRDATLTCVALRPTA